MVRFEKYGYEYDILSYCRFLSRLQGIDEGGGQAWKLLTMEVIYIQDSVVLAFPHSDLRTLELGDWKGSTHKSYKYLSWLLAEQGHEVGDDLPGVDDEQSVKTVMTKSYEWLKSPYI
jgi:hypothetical protein